MKQVLAAYILPALVSATAIFYLASSPDFNNYLFPEKQSKEHPKPFVFIENFSDSPQFEELFLQDDESPNIFLLGSSELTGETEASPYRFIPEHFSTKLKAVGHAGNQCFSIFSQLLANQDRLKDARITIIISPMWFFSKEAEGTSSKIFLEFNSENFLNRISRSSSSSEFKEYENKRISEMFSDFSSPGFAIKQMHFQHQASKSPLHYLIYKPIIKTDEILLKAKFHITDFNDTHELPVRKPVIADEVNINWDSLFNTSKNESLKKMTNNSWGIYDDYYSEYIKGSTSKIKIGPMNENSELEDFKMLVKLLKNKNANASFVIIPMNPYYYVNLNDAKPILNIIEQEIKNSAFPYYNFWVNDTSGFEKGVLRDIMHLSTYGWYKADKFIIETYHLTK